jgi:hypothetical protein
MALSYLKTEMPNRRSDSASAAAPAETTDKAVRLDRAPEVKKLSTPVKLVYSCDKDRAYYHTSNHIQRCERVAMSEEAALKRDLKPCPVCMAQ